jgi:hypothetical protein
MGGGPGGPRPPKNNLFRIRGKYFQQRPLEISVTRRAILNRIDFPESARQGEKSERQKSWNI